MTRLSLALCLLAALVLPKVSGVLIEIVPGMQRVVLCSGSEMIVILIGPDGIPVEEPASDHAPCIAADPTGIAPAPLPLWQSLAVDFTDPFRVKIHAAANADRAALTWPSRAPPVPV
ncbi:hypothetical protein [Aestuariibius insulae]|uniref:hypothetical protein n=1 Tax=Aestuariibius insulae TaxID=2058287 RepID=UPI00398EB385